MNIHGGKDMAKNVINKSIMYNLAIKFVSKHFTLISFQVWDTTKRNMYHISHERNLGETCRTSELENNYHALVLQSKNSINEIMVMSPLVLFLTTLKCTSHHSNKLDSVARR